MSLWIGPKERGEVKCVWEWVIRYIWINVRIATPEALYHLKKDTIRHKDKFDATYFAGVADLWNFANKLNLISYPRGILKFRTIGEANAHREQVELEHALKKQA